MNDFIINDNVLESYKGWEKHVIIPKSVTSIGDYAFAYCSDLTEVTIPDSVTSIGEGAFYGCSGLTKVTIPDSVTSIGSFAFGCCGGLTEVIVSDSITSVGNRAFGYFVIKQSPQKNIAYKGFYKDMTCRDFQYEEGKTYTCDEAKLCKCGFHACLNPLDCFNYYFGKDVVYHEVILEERINEKQFDSKICGKKITIGRRLTIKEMFDIFNELNK